MNGRDSKEALWFLFGVLFLSYCVFWGPLAFFGIEAANLVTRKTGPAWALLLFMFGGFVPSMVGIAMTMLSQGKAGIRTLFRSSIKVKFELKWYLLGLGVAAYYALSVILLYGALGGRFDFMRFVYQLPTIIPLFFFGPLSEEFGWRGFVLPRVLKCCDATLGSLVIGVVWALWHLPLFYMAGTSQYEFHIPYPPFMVSVISSSFIYTYIYIKTNRSLFSAIFLHWIWTYAMQVASSGVRRTYLFDWLGCIPPLILAAVFVLLLKKETRAAVPRHGT